MVRLLEQNFAPYFAPEVGYFSTMSCTGVLYFSHIKSALTIAIMREVSMHPPALVTLSMWASRALSSSLTGPSSSSLLATFLVTGGSAWPFFLPLAAASAQQMIKGTEEQVKIKLPRKLLVPKIRETCLLVFSIIMAFLCE